MVADFLRISQISAIFVGVDERRKRPMARPDRKEKR